jgi:multicomponent Na+:H+ antiporter subunit D
LSIIGVPLTAGFVSKWVLIKASLEAGYWGLVVVIVFSSVLAIIYIWKFIEVAYFKEPDKEFIAIDSNQKIPYLLFFALFVFVLANVYFGLDSSLNVDMANAIARGFYQDFVAH